MKVGIVETFKLLIDNAKCEFNVWREQRQRIKEIKQLERFKEAVNRGISSFIDNLDEEYKKVFLSNIYIESAGINGIGAGTVAILRSRGIYTACDLYLLFEEEKNCLFRQTNAEKLDIMPLIGPIRAGQLEEWMNHIEYEYGSPEHPESISDSEEILNSLMCHILHITESFVPKTKSGNLVFCIPSDADDLKMKIKYANGMIKKCMITNHGLGVIDLSLEK